MSRVLSCRPQIFSLSSPHDLMQNAHNKLYESYRNVFDFFPKYLMVSEDTMDITACVQENWFELQDIKHARVQKDHP